MTPQECTVGGLRTFVHRSRRPRAVLFIRTPYNSETHLAEASHWAQLGFTTVVQDVRGRYGSSGAFRPYDLEGADGMASIEWMTQQPWWPDAPRLVLYGASYGAHCAVETAAAAERSEFEQLIGVSVVVPALGMGETARNKDGAFYLASRHGWWAQHGDSAVSQQESRASDVLLTLPVSEIGAKSDPPITSWHTVLSALRSDEERSRTVARMTIPLLAQGGTADWFAQDTVDLFSWWGGPSALALGPWDHGMRGSGRGERMSCWLDDVLERHPWTGARLYGASDGPAHPLDAWPTAVEKTTLPGGSFDADPLQPFPSCDLGADVGFLLGRSDCLVRPVPSRAGIAVGSPMVRVDTAESNRHWGAMLVVHRRDGRAEQLAQGMSLDNTVHLGRISTRIHYGEELSVIVSAHSFPRHARDLQTGEDHLHGRRTQAVRRTVRGIVVEMPA